MSVVHISGVLQDGIRERIFQHLTPALRPLPLMAALWLVPPSAEERHPWVSPLQSHHAPPAKGPAWPLTSKGASSKVRSCRRTVSRLGRLHSVRAAQTPRHPHSGGSRHCARLVSHHPTEGTLGYGEAEPKPSWPGPRPASVLWLCDLGVRPVTFPPCGSVSPCALRRTDLS